jgi:hypothetical protein
VLARYAEGYALGGAPKCEWVVEVAEGEAGREGWLGRGRRCGRECERWVEVRWRRGCEMEGEVEASKERNGRFDALESTETWVA